MTGKKIGPRIILSAFVLIICMSGLWWSLLKDHLDSENHENRVLAAKPDFSIKNYQNYSREYEAFFNDNLQFRNNLVTMNTAIDYYLFKKSSNPKVAIGKDDWLYYVDEGDGDPIACYQGRDALSEDELKALADNCVKNKEFLEKQGKEFVIFIAPNKERIYSEFMASQYGKPAEVYLAKQVVDYLREHTDIRVVYPYEELMEAKEKLSQNIYYKTDSHWNHIGGYVGAKALLNELGIKMPDLYGDEITITGTDGYVGDLAAMLNFKNQLSDIDKSYIVAGYNKHDYKELVGDLYNATIYEATNADPRKVYLCRDSYASHMANFIGSQFNNTYFRHRNTYTYEDFASQNPDVFVYETVERYTIKLGTFKVYE